MYNPAFNVRSERIEEIAANLKLVKREGDFCISSVWDICGLHVGRLALLWIAAESLELRT